MEKQPSKQHAKILSDFLTMELFGLLSRYSNQLARAAVARNVVCREDVPNNAVHIRVITGHYKRVA